MCLEIIEGLQFKRHKIADSLKGKYFAWEIVHEKGPDSMARRMEEFILIYCIVIVLF